MVKFCIMFLNLCGHNSLCALYFFSISHSALTVIYPAFRANQIKSKSMSCRCRSMVGPPLKVDPRSIRPRIIGPPRSIHPTITGLPPWMDGPPNAGKRDRSFLFRNSSHSMLVATIDYREGQWTGNSRIAVSYTHLTLPTNREV